MSSEFVQLTGQTESETAADIPFEQAVESFVRGFTYTRSFTHPYVATALGERIWLLHDAPRTSGDRRGAELIVWRRDSVDVAALIDGSVTDRCSISVLTEAINAEDAETMAEAYRHLGYRLISREVFFVAQTEGVRDAPDERIVPVTSPALADAVNKAARRRQILPAHLAEADPALRLFAAMVDGTFVGWAQSIRTHADCAWVSSVFVQREHRNRGLGRALMNALMCDDARRGIANSVLLASKAGARLYPHVGYRQIGLLLLFTTSRRGES